MIARRTGEMRNMRDGLFFPIERQFDKIINDFFGQHDPQVSISSGYPKLDAVRTDNTFALKVAVPGVTKDQLQIELNDDGSLQISGEMSEEYRREEQEVYVRELHKSRFSRRITIPEDAVGDPEAKLKDGILQLTWQVTAKAKQKPKLIEVKEE